MLTRSGGTFLCSPQAAGPSEFSRCPPHFARLWSSKNRRKPFPTMRLRTISVTHPGPTLQAKASLCLSLARSASDSSCHSPLTTLYCSYQEYLPSSFHATYASFVFIFLSTFLRRAKRHPQFFQRLLHSLQKNNRGGGARGTNPSFRGNRSSLRLRAILLKAICFSPRHYPRSTTHCFPSASATKIISGDSSSSVERSKSPYTALTRNPHRASKCSTS